jgi:hypothetical protein
MSDSRINAFTPKGSVPIQKSLDGLAEITYQEIFSTAFFAPSVALPSTVRLWSNTSLDQAWQTPQQLPIDKFKNFKVYNISITTNLVPSALTDQNQAIFRDSAFLRIIRQAKEYPRIGFSTLFNSAIESAGGTYTLVARQQWGLNIGQVDPMFIMKGDEDWQFFLDLPTSITTGLTGLFPTLPFAPSGFTNGVYIKLKLIGQVERPVG